MSVAPKRRRSPSFEETASDDDSAEDRSPPVARKLDNAEKVKHHNEKKRAHPSSEARTSDGDSTDEDRSPPSQKMRNCEMVAKHYNERKDANRLERLESGIIYMRNFNNWIKSQLIHEYLGLVRQDKRVGDPVRALDLCCGKGGDLLKWEKGSISHLVCTDIADVSVEQCQKRYEIMASRAANSKYSKKFTAEFFACDATQVRLRERYKDPSQRFDLVSCQFAFHYSFESLSQAEQMVLNATDCLQPGGYFIATIPDSNEIMRRLRESDTPQSFGNDVYRIEFSCDTDPPPLFGAKYEFHLDGVVDCPEFLVHFPTMVKLCRKHGLKLERKTTFVDYYKENLERGRTLLQRMHGLETVELSRCKKDKYAHLGRLHENASPGKRVGTMSQTEWEASTLYMVCAFRKVAFSWGTDGKPVYEFD